MSDLDLRLRISADGRVAVVESGKVKGVLKEIGDEAERAGKKGREAFNPSSMRDYISHADRLGSTLRGVAGVTATIYTVRKFMQIADDIVTAQIQLDKLNSTFRFLSGGGARAAGEEMDYVRKMSRDMGLELNRTASSYAKMAAAAKGTRLEGEPVRQMFEAMSKASAVLGMSSDDLEGALRALQQMISKGTVMQEEMRQQLGERLPGAFQIAARAMGVTTQQLSKMMEQVQVFTDEFFPKFRDQLEKEFGPAFETAANQAQQRMNRIATSWQNMKQQVAQTGLAEWWLRELEDIRNGFDAVARAMETARKQGAGFWGQAAGAAGAGLRWLDPTNIITGSDHLDPLMIQAERLRGLALRRQMLSGEGGNRDFTRIDAEIAQLQASLMAANARASEASSQRGRSASEWQGEDDREGAVAAAKKLHDLRLKLLGEYGDKKARFEREWGEAKIELEASKASAELIAEVRAQLYEKIYGADAKQKGEAHYREMMALEEGQQRILAANQEARVAAVKMALDQDLISQRQYYASVAELEQHALETRRQSVQRQLDAAQGSKDPAKAAEVARYKAELEQLATEEQAIAARKNAAILKLDEQLTDDRLALQRELYQKEMSAVDAFVVDFQKKWTDKIIKYLNDGNQEMVELALSVFRAGLESAEFSDAKRAFDSLLAGFKEQLAEIRDDAEETDGIVGMLQAGEAGLELRNKFLPELQRALDKLRELAASNPALKPIVAAATREVTRASAESIAVWRGMVNDFVGIWRDGAAAAVEGGKPAFIQWIRDLRTRIQVGIAQYLAEIFARRYALNFVANMADGVMGPGSGLAGAARAASGVDALGTASNLGGMGNFLGAAGGAMSWAGNAMGWAGLAEFGAGMSLGAAGVGVGASAGIGAGAGTAGAVGATSAAGAGSTVATAIPYIGWVIAAYLILSSLLDDGPENPNLTMRQGEGGRGAFGGLDFTGTMAGGDMSAFYRMIGGVDEAALRVLSPEQQGRVTQRLGDFTRGGRRTDGQPLEMAFGEGEDAGEPIALELLRSRYAAVFDEISPRAAAAIRGFQGTSQELHRLITTMLSVQEVVQSAGGRLDWFTNIMSDFATSSEAVQQAAGQMIGYLATDIQAMFDEAANGPRTAYASWFRLGDQIRDWTDLSERGIVQLGQLTQQRYQAEIELVRQIASAVEDVDAMFSDTIREITLMTLDTPARYDFIRAETDELMRQVGVTNDPELLREMSQRINSNMRELFGMLDPGDQRARLGEYTAYLGDANDVVQQRLAAARAQVEAERNTALATSVATAIENALKEFAEKQRLAAADFATGASTFNGATDRFSQTVDRGLTITIDGQRYALTEVNGGGGDSE